MYNRVKNIIDENDCGFVYERDGNRFHKKYFFNEEYFDIIDKQDKAYWLGFLYADGYLIGKNAIGCSLNKKDKTHLELFLNEINVNENPLRYEKSTNSYNFRLTSQHMYDKLVEYGFSTEKSYDITDKPFKVIPDALKKYFVLGFFDGDGYVSLSSENCNLVGVVTNNSDLLKAIVDFANK